jgi:hypothetical protein
MGPLPRGSGLLPSVDSSIGGDSEVRPKGREENLTSCRKAISSKVSIVLDWKQGTKLADDRARDIGRGEGALYADWQYESVV